MQHNRSTVLYINSQQSNLLLRILIKAVMVCLQYLLELLLDAGFYLLQQIVPVKLTT